MNITALVPMKDHSERVPGKNIKNFNGKPLFYYILENLLKVKYIKKIVVNTDSNKIIELLKKDFSEVIIHERTKDLQGDFISMNKIINYDIDKTNDVYFLQTHSTNPLLSSESIEKSIELFIEKQKEGYDSLFSVTRWQTRFYWQDGSAINHNPEELIRTQDLPIVYEENSCLYIFSKESFKVHQRRIGKKPFMFETPKIESSDIDESIDFLIAEQIHILKSNENKNKYI